MRGRLLKKVVMIGTVVTMSSVASFTGAVGADQGTPFSHSKSLYELRTVVGNGEVGRINGTALEAQFFQPSSIAVSRDGQLYIADTYNHLIRTVKQGEAATYSGQIVSFDESSFPEGGIQNGAITEAVFHSPTGISIDDAGNLYIADSENHMIRKINADGQVTTLAGKGLIGLQDGNGEDAQFYNPSDVAVDSKGNVYVSDTLNHVIRKIDVNGIVSTLNSPSERVVEYVPGAVELVGDFEDGKLSQAKFNEPTGLVVDDQDNLYVSDRGNQRVRYIDFKADTVTTVAGGGDYEVTEPYALGEYVDGLASEARFASPEGLALTKDGTLLVADKLNHVIRAIKDGQVSTIAGVGDEFGNNDGILSHGRLHQPTDVAVTEDGTILIADTFNNKIKAIQLYERPIDLPEDETISIVLNGKQMISEVHPQIYNNKNYVPIRSLAQGLGLGIHFNEDSHLIYLKTQDNVSYIFSKQGTEVMKVENGVESKLELEGITRIEGNRLLIPVRFFAEELGYDVQWDKQERNVVIRNPIFE